MQAHYARATRVSEAGTARRYAASFTTIMDILPGILVLVPFSVWLDVPEVRYGTCVDVPRALRLQAATWATIIKTQGVP